MSKSESKDLGKNGRRNTGQSSAGDHRRAGQKKRECHEKSDMVSVDPSSLTGTLVSDCMKHGGPLIMPGYLPRCLNLGACCL